MRAVGALALRHRLRRPEHRGGKADVAVEEAERISVYADRAVDRGDHRRRHLCPHLRPLDVPAHLQFGSHHARMSEEKVKR